MSTAIFILTVLKQLAVLGKSCKLLSKNIFSNASARKYLKDFNGIWNVGAGAYVRTWVHYMLGQDNTPVPYPTSSKFEILLELLLSVIFFDFLLMLTTVLDVMTVPSIIIFFVICFIILSVFI